MLAELSAFANKMKDMDNEIEALNNKITTERNYLAQNFGIQSDELTNVTDGTDGTDGTEIGAKIKSQQPQKIDIRSFFSGGGSSTQAGNSNQTELTGQDFFNGGRSSSQAGNSSQVESSSQVENSSQVESSNQAGNSSQVESNISSPNTIGKIPTEAWPRNINQQKKRIRGEFKTGYIYADNTNRLISLNDIKIKKVGDKKFVESINGFPGAIRLFFSAEHCKMLKKECQYVVEGKKMSTVGSASGDISACVVYWQKYQNRPSSSTVTTTTQATPTEETNYGRYCVDCTRNLSANGLTNQSSNSSVRKKEKEKEKENEKKKPRKRQKTNT